MLVRLSCKGQLVIPKAIRRVLVLEAGDQLYIQLVEDKIVLKPATGSSPLASLHGKYSECDLIGDLEREHQQEIAREQPLRV